MPLIVACAGCRRQLRLGDAAAGRQVRCPRCKAVFTATAPPPVEIEYAPDIEIDDDPPPPSPRRRAQEEDRPQFRRARRVDDDEEDGTPRPARAEDEEKDAHEVAESLKWEEWADRRVRTYIYCILLPGAVAVGLAACLGFLVSQLPNKPEPSPGMKYFWVVLALFSGLMLATCVGFFLKADWPFGTLITVAPVMVSNALVGIVRRVNPDAKLTSFYSQLPFLLVAVAVLAGVWLWLQRRPNRRAADRAVDYFEKRKLGGWTGDSILSDLIDVGNATRLFSAVVTLVAQRFRRERERQTQIVLGLASGSLAYVVIILLAVAVIGTRESRARQAAQSAAVPSAAEQKQDLQFIALTYHQFHDDRKRSPRDVDELAGYDVPATRETRTRVEAALKSGKYVVVWNAKLGPRPDALLAYYRDAPEKGGAVCYVNGEFATLTREQFAQTPKARAAPD